MKSGRLYAALTWGAAAAVAALIVASWVDLYAVHAAAEGVVRQIDRKAIVPKLAVEVIGFTAVGIAILGVAFRTWRRSAPILLQETVALLRAPAGGNPVPGKALDAPGSVRRPLAAALRHIAGGGMAECEDFQQWFGHLLTMWGFIGLFATTSLDALVNRPADPLPLLHPVRLLGNVTGLMFMVGLTLAMARRAFLAKARAASRTGDWTFLLALWGTGATGYVVQWFADHALLTATTWGYLFHLVFVGAIVASAPWTKFVHAVWRPSWVVYRELLAERIQ